ncbi:MAG: C4-type zinc ribbon domain-containing protein [Kiritimatiellia bacterium]
MTVIEQLLNVQEFDCAIRAAEREIEDIPARQAREEDRLNSRRKTLSDIEKTLKAKEADVHQQELEISARREKATKLRQQQLELKTNKEFRAMEEEIDAVQADIGGLEDRELRSMEEAEQFRAELEKTKKEQAREEASVREEVSALNGRMSEIEKKLQGLKESRKEAARGVDPEWLEKYERIFERKDRALVQVQDSVCSGCHMKLAPYVPHDIKKKNTMVVCDHCGRMLY